MIRDERAVSDVVAFILVFSIIITSVALVYAFGFSGLEDYAQGEQSRHAAQAMDALSLNLNDLQRGPTPERSGELSLRGGRLSTQNGTTVTINVSTGAGSPTITQIGPISMGALTYETDGSSISYEGGAVVRSERGGSVMLTEPEVTCSTQGGETVAVISIVNVTETGAVVSADGLVEVEAVVPEGGREVHVFREDVNGVEMNFSDGTPEQAVAWERHIDATFGGNTCAADTVYVRITNVDVAINAQS